MYFDCAYCGHEGNGVICENCGKETCDCQLTNGGSACQSCKPEDAPDVCPQCGGSGQVCNECKKPGKDCKCPNASLPPPMLCPRCVKEKP